KSPLHAKSTPASISTVGDLRGLAASSLDSLKRRLAALHADNARDLEASHSRISKRIKMHTQSCLKIAEEAEKEHKKILLSKLVTEVQSSSSRVCKVTLPEMATSVARARWLVSRYNILATTA
ncbi:hypothetical protein ZWY2020_031759, partial [Hordeum vulgare]